MLSCLVHIVLVLNQLSLAQYCYPQHKCDCGYMDETNGNTKYWACGVDCVGGKYITNGSCGCACIKNNPCTDPYCIRGLRNSNALPVCCDNTCGLCEEDDCNDLCCPSTIVSANASCDTYPPPCVITSSLETVTRIENTWTDDYITNGWTENAQPSITTISTVNATYHGPYTTDEYNNTQEFTLSRKLYCTNRSQVDIYYKVATRGTDTNDSAILFVDDVQQKTSVVGPSNVFHDSDAIDCEQCAQRSYSTISSPIITGRVVFTIRFEINVRNTAEPVLIFDMNIHCKAIFSTMISASWSDDGTVAVCDDSGLFAHGWQTDLDDILTYNTSEDSGEFGGYVFYEPHGYTSLTRTFYCDQTSAVYVNYYAAKCSYMPSYFLPTKYNASDFVIKLYLNGLLQPRSSFTFNDMNTSDLVFINDDIYEHGYSYCFDDPWLYQEIIADNLSLNGLDLVPVDTLFEVTFVFGNEELYFLEDYGSFLIFGITIHCVPLENDALSSTPTEFFAGLSTLYPSLPPTNDTITTLYLSLPPTNDTNTTLYPSLPPTKDTITTSSHMLPSVPVINTSTNPLSVSTLDQDITNSQHSDLTQSAPSDRGDVESESEQQMLPVGIGIILLIILITACVCIIGFKLIYRMQVIMKHADTKQTQKQEQLKRTMSNSFSGVSGSHKIVEKMPIGLEMSNGDWNITPGEAISPNNATICHVTVGEEGENDHSITRRESSTFSNDPALQGDLDLPGNTQGE